MTIIELIKLSILSSTLFIVFNILLLMSMHNDLNNKMGTYEKLVTS